jgi:protein-L-isoaspartate(D-aspartate) O-methyltransferase
VGAAAWPIPPALLAQLDCGGKMVIPVGPEGGPQQILMLSKDAAGEVTEERLLDVRYVPLTNK